MAEQPDHVNVRRLEYENLEKATSHLSTLAAESVPFDSELGRAIFGVVLASRRCGAMDRLKLWEHYDAEW